MQREFPAISEAGAEAAATHSGQEGQAGRGLGAGTSGAGQEAATARPPVGSHQATVAAAAPSALAGRLLGCGVALGSGLG